MSCVRPVLLAVLLAAGSAAVRADEAEHLLLLPPGRPIRLDFQIYMDGKPLRETWRARFDRLFAEADHGHVGRIEIPLAVRLCDDMSGQFGLEVPRDKVREVLKSLAAEGDTVDREKLLDYVERTFPPFSLNVAPAGTGSATALFALLDQNHDGQLSRQELAQAATQLFGRDFDDDQMISERELIIDPTMQLHRPGTDPPGTAPPPETAMLINSGLDRAKLAATLIRRYDHNGDGRLSIRGPQIELILTPETGDRLDANHDGELDADELQAFADQPADAVLPLDFGTPGPRRQASVAAASEMRLRKKFDNGGYKLYLGDAQIVVDPSNRSPKDSGPIFRFAALDADKNGYLDKMELRGSRLLVAAFEGLDADADGKVTPGEFQVYIDSQQVAAGNRVRLAVVDHGQDLFALIDENGDGLLTVRELLSAANLLKSEDRNGDGVLSGIEIPERWALELARGTLSTAETRLARTRTGAGAPQADRSAGPLWFRKMDRNQDGDLSRREFLGSSADFDAIDTNHDGLIDAAEAEAFSAQHRDKK